MSGPLDGVVVIELAGLGPAPFCGMVLADLGAEVIRVDRPGGGSVPIGSKENDVLNRGKRSVAIDLKHEAGAEVVLALVESADALIEGFRPGVAERLGVGPGPCLARTPSLVYARMTGWGQEGPMSAMAGHDIDYIALSGVLHAVGPADRPLPPLNLVGDFGGGGMMLAMGVLAAMIHSRAGGEGQVVDAAMVDGSALLMASHHGFLADGWWTTERESNLLDGGAPFYTTYRTSDGAHVAVGALEPQFFSALLDGLEIEPSAIGAQNDRDAWPDMRTRFAERFMTKTRDQWADHFAGTDACVAPVLSMSEAPEHPHNAGRGTFVEIAGVIQPGPVPRFSSSPALVDGPPSPPGSDTVSILGAAGFSPDHIGKLRESGAIA
ncbi:MAG TPA: CaiB/BaiF CoA-transferase family protein [Acidimicrobiia bacterium]|nr:CaiB/BaiF CoA-transferase family protein [Acidimicrobiia bacterium]